MNPQSAPGGQASQPERPFRAAILRLWPTVAGMAVAAAALLAASCSSDRPAPSARGQGGVGMDQTPRGPLVVDVRTPDEYAAGHLAGAILLPHETAAESLSRMVPDRQAPIALYCRSGRRSGLVLAELQAKGYTRAVNWGGFEELAKARPAVWPSR